MTTRNPLRQVASRYFEVLYQAMCEDRYHAQIALVEHNPQAIVLDCGCREGDNTLNLAAQIGASRLIGLDYNLGSLIQANKRNIRTLQSDLNLSIPFASDQADVIIATDVIEHLIHPWIFVHEMYRVIKPGGYAIIDTPNLASWHNIFALLLGLQPFSGPNITTMEDADVGLVKQMHRKTHGLAEEGDFIDHGEQELVRHIVVLAYISLVKLFKDAGFTIERAYGFGYYPLPVFLARIFQRLDIRHTHHILLKVRKS